MLKFFLVHPGKTLTPTRMTLTAHSERFSMTWTQTTQQCPSRLCSSSRGKAVTTLNTTLSTTPFQASVSTALRENQDIVRLRYPVSLLKSCIFLWLFPKRYNVVCLILVRWIRGSRRLQWIPFAKSYARIAWGEANDASSQLRSRTTSALPIGRLQRQEFSRWSLPSSLEARFLARAHEQELLARGQSTCRFHFIESSCGRRKHCLKTVFDIIRFFCCIGRTCIIYAVVGWRNSFWSNSYCLRIRGNYFNLTFMSTRQLSARPQCSVRPSWIMH